MVLQSPSLDKTSKPLQHAERLSLLPRDTGAADTKATTAAEAKFITPLEPIIIAVNEGRLKLNELKSDVDRGISGTSSPSDIPGEEKAPLDAILRSGTQQTILNDQPDQTSPRSQRPEANFHNTMPWPRTNPLFPPLPLYGPPSLLRHLECYSFRISSFFLSLTFLGTIVVGSIFASLPMLLRHIGMRLILRNPDARRIFHKEEEKRRKERKDSVRAWKKLKGRERMASKSADADDEEMIYGNKYEPTEGGKDALVCDVGYYARRVGLDVEEFRVKTEDGFIIILWHVYNPLEDNPVPQSRRSARAPKIFATNPDRTGYADGHQGSDFKRGKRKYPVLLIHGLLQSSGAYCCNDDDSLAFFLCKRYEPIFEPPKVH
jgi:hypothetical protein